MASDRRMVGEDDGKCWNGQIDILDQRKDNIYCIFIADGKLLVDFFCVKQIDDFEN